VERDWAELARRARSGDRSAFRTIVERTHVAAFRVALRTLGDAAEAEDTLQEAYLLAWNERERLRDPVAARAWIYGIVRNLASNRARGRQRRAAHELVGDAVLLQGLTDYLASEQPGPEHAAASAELRTVLLDLLARLDEKHRVVLLLRAVDGMSYDELAETLGVPVGTVESRIHRARAKLLEALERALGPLREVTR
jgi:RNA polymerase sigma-70 factor, ECF subfamily